MSRLVVGSAIASGTSPAITAATRKSRTRPGSTSVDSTPAAATTNPDDVARNAAIAPAATSAPSRLPSSPPTVAAGSSSSNESA